MVNERGQGPEKPSPWEAIRTQFREWAEMKRRAFVDAKNADQLRTQANEILNNCLNAIADEFIGADGSDEVVRNFEDSLGEAQKFGQLKTLNVHYEQFLLKLSQATAKKANALKKERNEEATE